MIGLKEVYEIDPVTGNILSLEDISSKMAPAIPKCPHCQLSPLELAAGPLSRFHFHFDLLLPTCAAAFPPTKGRFEVAEPRKLTIKESITSLESCHS